MARAKLDDLSRRRAARDQLAEAKDDLFKLRFQHATGQLTNYRRMGQVRRDVARVHDPAARPRDRRRRGAGGPLIEAR